MADVNSPPKWWIRVIVPLLIAAWLPLLIALQGCISPNSRFDSAQGKVDKIEAKISTNQLASYQIARDYTYAADFTLRLNPEPNRYTDTAKTFTEKSLIASGLPGIEEANRLRSISTNLLSTNVTDVAAGNAALAKKDAELAQVQQERADLQVKLGKAEEKLEAVNKENAAMATTLWKIKNVLKWIGFGFGGLVLVMIFCAVAPIFMPALAPLAALLGNAVGGIFKIIFRAVPAAANGAGVVAKKAFDTSESTLKTLVDALQEARAKDPSVKGTLDALLKEYLDKEHKKKIIDVKTELGYV